MMRSARSIAMASTVKDRGLFWEKNSCQLPALHVSEYERITFQPSLHTHTHTHTHLYIYIYIWGGVVYVSWPTVVESDTNGLFSIVTPPICWGGATIFPGWLYLPLIRGLWYWVLNKDTSSTIFLVFGTTRPGIEAWSPRPVENTLPAWAYMYISFT